MLYHIITRHIEPIKNLQTTVEKNIFSDSLQYNLLIKYSITEKLLKYPFMHVSCSFIRKYRVRPDQSTFLST